MMKNLNITLYIIGENRKIFIELSKKYGVEYIDSHTLPNAVKEIDKRHDNKSVAVLSPACASFDQFKSYKHRGEEFKKCVMSI
jgi:UDP-N-acetylmuramoylalanine--D-glutamate ligase